MLSQSGTYDQMPVFPGKFSPAESGKKPQIRADDSAQERHPHHAPVIMSGKDQVASPFQIGFPILWGMGQKDLKAVFFSAFPEVW